MFSIVYFKEFIVAGNTMAECTNLCLVWDFKKNAKLMKYVYSMAVGL